MTQIIVTLDPSADSSLLQKMINNMKGVFKTTIKESSGQDAIERSNDWLEKLHSLQHDINPDKIDMSDERTQYIMSK